MSAIWSGQSIIAASPDDVGLNPLGELLTPHFAGGKGHDDYILFVAAASPVETVAPEEGPHGTIADALVAIREAMVFD